MRHYISVDVGGTNVTIGLMQIHTHSEKPQISILEYKKYLSKDSPDITPLLSNSITYFTEQYSLSSVPPISISMCGPTDGETGQPTNLPDTWFMDKKKLQSKYNTDIFLINDFAAIAYGVLTLQEKDNNTVHIPPSPKIDLNDTKPSVKVAIGAGTGLGTATIYHDSNTTALISSEAGWLDFASNPHDIHETQFLQFLKEPATQITPYKTPYYSWEDSISGSRGINNIYHFFCDSTYSQDIISDKHRKYLQDTFMEEPHLQRPAKISAQARQDDEYSRAIFDFWVKLYAKYARQIACVTLPYGGIFIGGGVASKNLSLLLRDNLFYSHFIYHYNEKIQALLQNIPLYVITEYTISLYGNAFYIYTQLKQ